MAFSSCSISDFLIFAATALFIVLKEKALAADDTCKVKSSNKPVPGGLVNSAFVFVKPHANTAAVGQLVREKLSEAGVHILSEIDIDGTTIDEKKLIDQHYYAIASKATILSAPEIPVPPDKFQEAFGEPWNKVLKENRACNAMEACKRFGCTAAELNEAWQKSDKVVKFGGGFYCGLVSFKESKLYVFNAFFMSMRSKFVGKDASIHAYEVEWNPADLSWSSFRNSILGPTDPSVAPLGSLRRTIFQDYIKLGLSKPPDKGDNGVHASASPLEGLAEKKNWLGKSIDEVMFGKALLKAGLSMETIEEWCVDPRITLPDGSMGSVFDALEDMDAADCLKKMVVLNDLNSNDVI